MCFKCLPKGQRKETSRVNPPNTNCDCKWTRAEIRIDGIIYHSFYPFQVCEPCYKLGELYLRVTRAVERARLWEFISRDFLSCYDL